MNRLSKKMLALGLMLGAAESVFAADLLSIYREAQVQDATYAGAKAQYIGAQERLPQARALLLPSVNFGAGAHYNSVDTEYKNSVFPSGKRDFYDYNYGINLTTIGSQKTAVAEPLEQAVGRARANCSSNRPSWARRWG